MARDLNLIDYRTALRRGEEISIGAYARRVRRRRIIVAICGVALIGAALTVYALLRPHFLTMPSDYPVAVRCVSEGCGFNGTVMVSSGQGFPVKCPTCGKHSCRQLWRCNDCKAVFLPDEGRAPQCPACRSNNTGSAAVAADDSTAPSPAGPGSRPSSP